MSQNDIFAPAQHMRWIDWSNFDGPKRNVEWKPDDQDLVYTALNYRDDEYGDADEDVGQQLVERLLAAWKQTEKSLHDLDERLAEAEAIVEERDDRMALVDHIADLIGLPHNQELDQVAFELWFSAISPPPQTREAAKE